MKQDEIQKRIFDAIGRGEVKMRPKWYFAARAMLAAFLAILFFALLVFSMSMVIFALHENGAWFALDFGLSGWYLFFRSLPLVLVVTTLLFAIAVAVLARRYAFVYHRPLVYLLLVIAGLTTVASFLVAPTALHRAIMSYAEANHLPFVGTFYEFEEAAPSTVHRGRIVTFRDNSFVLQDVQGRTTTVILLATTSYGVGDTVVVLGEENASGTVTPFGIERVVSW